jgi:hypothetical protein
MKVLMQFGLCCLLASGALAQHHGSGGGHGGFVGGGSSRGFTGGIRAGGGYGRGAFGNRGYRGFGYRGFYGPRFYGGYWPGLWDFGYWDSPYYDYANSSAYSGGPNVTVVYVPPAQQPIYPVVVEQPARPVIREYHQPEDYGLPAERESRPVIYLIAFRDQVIHAAMTYWVDGGTLHYLDMDHKEKQTPLSAVDGDFSTQLNRERRVPFHLPAP